MGEQMVNNRIGTTNDGQRNGLTKRKIYNAYLSEQETGMRYALLDSVRNGRFRQTKLLVDADADINGQDETGTTCLILCCTNLPDAKTRTKFVRLLLDANADTNIQDKNGMSVLMHATVLGQPDVVLMILDHNGTDLDLKDNEGNTALMYAATFGHSDIVKYLLNQMGRLKQVIHLSQKNYKGMTALQQAERNGHHEVSSILGKEKPGFPKGLSDREFPDPSQLDRGPTPGSPLKSFPVRWQQRKVLEKSRIRQMKDKNQPTEMEESQKTTAKEANEKVKEIITDTNDDNKDKKLQSGLFLPKLNLKDTSVNSQPISMDIVLETPVTNKETWNYQLTTDKNFVVPPPSRRSRSEPRNSGSTTSIDRFQKVLNLLDASIPDDPEDQSDQSEQDMDRNCRHYSRRPIKCDQKLRGRYFPPIRPLHTTLLSSVHNQQPRLTPPKTN